jgi:dolichol-phosphate mannosyltransferase
MAEVPITFTDRAVGTSKMTSDIVREAMLRVLTWRWRELAHKPVVWSVQGGEDRHDIAV